MSDMRHRHIDPTFRGPDDDAADHGLDLARIVGAFRRRRGLFLGTVLGMTALVAVVATQLTPRYAATATVMIEPQRMHVLNLQAVAEGMPAWQSGSDTPLATQVNILTSRNHARRVVQALELEAIEEFQPRTDSWRDADVGTTLAALRDASIATVQRIAEPFFASVASGSDDPGEGALVRLSADDAPPQTQPSEHLEGEEPAGAIASRRSAPTDPVEAAVDALLARLSVHRDGQSQAILVRFSSGDPALAAKVANSVVDEYLQRQVEDKVATTDAAELWVNDRVVTLRGELLAAERRVERYRAEHDLLESRDGGLDSQQLASLNAQLIAARAERQAGEARLRRIRQLQSAGGSQDALAEFAGSPLIGSLRQQDVELQRQEAQLAQEFGTQHPRMLQLRAERADNRRKLEAEISTMVQGLAEEVALAASREQAIEASLEEAKGLSATARTASVELRDLERDAAARRTAYEQVLARLQELQEQRDLVRPDAVVLSTAAVPDRPSFPNNPLLLVIGFVGALGLGVVAVTLAELVDRTLRSAREVQQGLGLPAFALVPKVGRLGRQMTPAQYLVERPGSDYAEALREIEAACAAPGSGPLVLLVTSGLPGEGKTSLATGLGVVAARGGRRTIVVDLDIRHPSVETALGMSRSGGLTACALEGRPVRQAVREAPMEAMLHVLGNAGTRTGETGVVRSPGLRRVVDELRQTYDLVIIDSPPLLGLADTKQLAGLADRVLLAVRWGRTPTAAAKAALQSLRGVQASVAGVALTLVDLRRHARYGYADSGTYYNMYKRYYIN